MDSTGDPAEQTDPPTAPDTDATTPRLPQYGEGDQAVADGPGRPPNLAKWLAIYTFLRLGMLVVLAAVLSLLMPLILALLFAVVLALPLAWLAFGGVRRRVNEALAHSNAARRAERERLRSALNGEERR